MDVLSKERGRFMVYGATHDVNSSKNVFVNACAVATFKIMCVLGAEEDWNIYIYIYECIWAD